MAQKTVHVYITNELELEHSMNAEEKNTLMQLQLICLNRKGFTCLAFTIELTP